MVGYLLLALAGLFVAAYVVGRARALSVVDGEVSRLHSLPGQHGMFLALMVAGPALIAVLLWGLITPRIEASIVKSRFAGELGSMGVPQVEAFIRDAKAIAFGGVAGFSDATKEAAASVYRSIYSTSIWIIIATVALLAVAGFSLSYGKIAPAFRARHIVERILRGLLILCSVVAILTTVGIVLSLIFESLRFFQQVPVYKFLFGTHWIPKAPSPARAPRPALSTPTFLAPSRCLPARC